MGNTSDPKNRVPFCPKRTLSSPHPLGENISCNLMIPNDSEKRKAGGYSPRPVISIDGSCTQWLIQWRSTRVEFHLVIFPLSFPGERMGYECTKERVARKGGVRVPQAVALTSLQQNGRRRTKAFNAETHARAEIELY
ncbi:hypothetical protein CEXT_101641 [Caerostris extrusa]|uniref:Uncharacterized protein n=1 Tax=Caerostris extrusa TaxID=172846 RepID=A0AAV4NFF9_CAEEX|nr:hypothetical protein CEXT_101641 [Caerostris extrusa]